MLNFVTYFLASGVKNKKCSILTGKSAFSVNDRTKSYIQRHLVWKTGTKFETAWQIRPLFGSIRERSFGLKLEQHYAVWNTTRSCAGFETMRRRDLTVC